MGEGALMGLGPSAQVGALGVDKKLADEAAKKKPKTYEVKAGEQKQEHVQTDAERAAVAKNLRAVTAPTSYRPPDPRDRRKDYGLAENVTDEAYMMRPDVLGESARGSVQADAGSIAAQQRAMDELFGIYDQGGATAQDRAREGQARANSDQYIRGQREAHQQDLGERGMYGSGAEIGMLLGDRQNAATTMAQSDLDTQAMHEQRAMDALMKGGDMAGRMRDTSFQEGSDRALGEDEFAVLRNNTANQAKQGNVDFLRESKANSIQNEFRAFEGDKDRAFAAAGQVMGEDAEQNKAGWNFGANVATIDTGAANDAKGAVRDTVTSRRIDPIQSYGVDTGTSGALTSGDAASRGGVEKASAGFGAVGDGIMDFGAGVGSGGAMDFTGGSYDPTGKKKRT
jgi:hypothetical protein